MKTREDVWDAFADQLIAPEPRVWIPRAALCAFEAGLPRQKAYDVWCFEVCPAAMAQDFGDDPLDRVSWGRGWLVREIAKIAKSDLVRCAVTRFFYRVWALEAGGLQRNWRAIERCMRELETSTFPTELSASLTWLANRFFDHRESDQAPASAGTLRRVYGSHFLPTFRPLVRPSDGGIATCGARVMRALAQSDVGGPYRARCS